jgi:ribosomal protein S19
MHTQEPNDDNNNKKIFIPFHQTTIQKVVNYRTVRRQQPIKTHYKTTITIPAKIVEYFQLEKGQTLNIEVIKTDDGHMKLIIEEFPRGKQEQEDG